MIAVILLLAGGAAFHFFVYRHWKDVHRFVFKCVLVYIGLGITVLTCLAVVCFMGTVIEDAKDTQLMSRVGFIERTAENNDYAWLTVYMEGNKDYEEEFECYWERVIMHECAMQYRVFATAKAKDMGDEYVQKADKWEALMKKYCEHPTYVQNEPYGKYFMKLAGG